MSGASAPSERPFDAMPLSPAARGLVDRMQRAGRPPLHRLPVADARALFERGADVIDVPRAPLARVEPVQVPLRDGTWCAARLYAPSTARLPVLLYLHGGGYVVGSLETHDSLCRQLALRSGAAVLSLGYRLAPDHRFPTAVHDAWDALRWLAGAGAAQLRVDGDRLAVGGDSAGATLAAVSALMARDAALPLALQLLFYPATAATFDSRSHRTFAAGPVLDRALLAWFFGHCAAADQRADWRFAPLHAADHAGVAPAWIGLAGCDPLFDDGVAYGDALRAAGVPVDLEVWPGVMHDFIRFGRVLPEAGQAHAAAGKALRAALFPAAGPGHLGSRDALA